MRCLFIHLKFRHWSLDGSTFVAQAPQFSWTTQFRNGYYTVCVWTQEEVRSVIRFLWAKGTAAIEIHREIQAVYGSNVMTVQHVRKLCWEFNGCRVWHMNKGVGLLPHQQILSLQLRRLCVLIAECCLKSWKNSLIFHVAQSGTLFTNI